MSQVSPTESPRNRDAAAGAGAADRCREPGREAQLIDLAADLIRRTGTADAVTMEAIAREAGISKPVVYKWFANRDALVLALYHRENDRLDARVRASFITAASFEQKAKALLDAYLDVVDNDEPSVIDVLARTVAAPAFHAQRVQRNFEVLATIAAMVFEHFDVDEPQSLTAAVMITKSLEGVIELWLATGAPRDALSADFVSFCLAGLHGLGAPRPAAAN